MYQILDNCQQHGARSGDVRGWHATHGDAVDVLGVWHKNFSKPASFRRQQDIDLLTIAAVLTAANVAEPFHRLERRKGCRLHHTGLLAEFALREPIAFPQDAQERPMAERY